MWNGAAPNLNAMPTTMNTTPVSISTRSSPTSPPARSWIVARSSEYVAPYSSDMPNSSRPEASEPSRSEEHTSELQSLMRISYAVFCLKKKKKKKRQCKRTYNTRDEKEYQN